METRVRDCPERLSIIGAVVFPRRLASWSGGAIPHLRNAHQECLRMSKFWKGGSRGNFFSKSFHLRGPATFQLTRSSRPMYFYIFRTKAKIPFKGVGDVLDDG